MAEKNARIGGVRIDPGVAAWQQDAAINRAALSRKQVADRGRVRIKSDIPEAVKAGIVAQADRLQTSESQVVAFLLAWALHELAEGNGELDEALVQSRRVMGREVRPLHSGHRGLSSCLWATAA